MARKNVLQVQLNDEQMADLERRAGEAGMKVTGFARSLMFPADGQVTTGDKIAAPKRRPGRLCAACAKGGRARWNCPTCRPERVGAA